MSPSRPAASSSPCLAGAATPSPATLRSAAQLGFDIVEISTGFVTLPADDLVRLTEAVHAAGLKAKPEVGIQFGAGGASSIEALEAEGMRDVGQAIELAKHHLEAGAHMIMIESEGITEQVREWRTDVVARIVSELGLDHVMFEAADPDVFTWYIRNYGIDVNLFVDHSQIVQLECLRRASGAPTKPGAGCSATAAHPSTRGDECDNCALRRSRPSRRPSSAGARPVYQEVAQRAGMVASYLDYLEHSPAVALPRGSLIRLAGALETTVDYLRGGEVDRPPGPGRAGPHPHLDILSKEECEAHLAGGGVGRFVFLAKQGPVALPVNFRLARRRRRLPHPRRRCARRRRRHNGQLRSRPHR